MAQSALTVTPPSPTPPTNMGFVGSTPPNPATFDPTIYVSAAGSVHYPRPELAPYFDDGSAGALTELVSAHPSLLVGGTSIEHEGRGTEVVVTSPGSRAECPTQQVSVLGNYTAAPNQQHASTMSPATNPALVSIAPTTLAAAPTGTQLITCTGTGFVPGCRIWHDNVEQTTTFVSATSLTATVKKRTSAGVVPVVVKLGGLQMGAAPNFTWT